MIPMSDRTAGEGRYARPEREQRWVMGALPEPREHPVAVVDHYISGTRLRLRRMERETEVVYKLGQKVRRHPGRPEFVQLTNMYLSESEYAVLATLDGAPISKTRWQWHGGARSMVVDEFGGHLAGLIMAEVELQPEEPRMTAPPGAVTDVTDDDRFSGGTLAETSPAQLQALLEGLGVTGFVGPGR